MAMVVLNDIFSCFFIFNIHCLTICLLCSSPPPHPMAWKTDFTCLQPCIWSKTLFCLGWLFYFKYSLWVSVALPYCFCEYYLSSSSFSSCMVLALPHLPLWMNHHWWCTMSKQWCIVWTGISVVCVCGSECSLCHYLPIAVIPRLSRTWTYDFNVTVRVQTNAHANNYPVSVQESWNFPELKIIKCFTEYERINLDHLKHGISNE